MIPLENKEILEITMPQQHKRVHREVSIQSWNQYFQNTSILKINEQLTLKGEFTFAYPMFTNYEEYPQVIVSAVSPCLRSFLVTMHSNHISLLPISITKM